MKNILHFWILFLGISFSIHGGNQQKTTTPIHKLSKYLSATYCSDSTSIYYIQGNQKIKAFANSGVYEFCDSNSLTIYIDSLMYSKSTITWFKNDIAIPSSHSFSLIIPAQKSSSSTYYALISNGSCTHKTIVFSTAFNSLFVQLVEPETLTKDSSTLCSKNGVVGIIATSSNAPGSPVYYQWYRNNIPITNTENSSKNYLQTSQDGIYHLVQKSGNCIARSNNFKVISSPIIDNSLQIIDGLDLATFVKSKNVCENYLGNVKLAYTGTASSTSFYRNNVDIGSPVAYVNKPGIYKVRFEQGECVKEDSVTITYGKKMDINIEHSLFNSTHYTSNFQCNNPRYENAIYCINNYEFSNYTSTKNQPNEGYLRWLKEGNQVATGTYFIPKETGDYTLVYRDEAGCEGASLPFKVTEIFEHKKIPIYVRLWPLSTKMRVYKSNTSFTICSNQSIIFTPYMVSTQVDIVWKKNGVPVPSDKLEYNSFSPHLPLLIANETGQYWAELRPSSDPNCYYVSDTITVNVVPNKVVTIADLCITNSSIPLQYSNVNKKDIYQWFLNDTAIANANAPTLNTQVNGNYHLLVDDGLCLYKSNEISLSQQNFYDIDVPANITICSGGTVSFNVKGTNITSFSWIDSNKIAGKGASISIANYKNSGKITVTGFSSNGCSISKDVNINVIPLPSITIQDSCVLNNNTTPLTAISTTPNLSYQWSYQDKPISNANTTKFIATSQGSYSVKATTQEGCINTSNNINLPTYTLNIPASIELCSGDTLNISPSNTNISSFLWTGINSFTSNASALYVPHIKASGIFNLTGKTKIGCTISKDIKVGITERPDILLSDTCQVANAIPLKTKASLTNLSYEWYLDGSLIDHAASSYFAIQNGIYTVKASNNQKLVCSKMSNQIKVSLISKLTPNVITPCRGDTLKIIAKTSKDIKSYSWTGPDNFQSKDTSVIIPNYKKSGTFTVNVSTTAGCILSKSTWVEVYDYPSFSVISKLFGCEGQSMIFNPIQSNKTTDTTETADVVKWTGPNNFKSTVRQNMSPILLRNLNTLNEGLYTAIVSSNNNSSCTVKASTTLTINKNADCKSLLVTIPDDTLHLCGQSYNAIYFTNTGFTKGTVFSVIQKSTGKILGNGTQSPITINVPENNTLRPVLDYLYIVADDKSESNSIPFYINSKHLVYLQSVNNNGTFDACISLTLSSNAQNSIGNNQWYKDGKLFQSNSKIITTNQSGLYKMVYTDSYNCIIESFEQQVNINKIPPAIIVGSSEIYCQNQNTQLNISNYTAQNTYKWYKNGKEITSYLNKSSVQETVGQYVVETQNGKCSSNSDTLTVKQNTQKVIFPITLSAYGDKTTLTCETPTNQLVFNNPYFYESKVQYFKNGVEFAPTIYNNGSFLVNSTGSYRIRLISSSGCVANSNELIVKKTPYNKSSILNKTLQTEVCKDQSFWLEVSSALNGYINNYDNTSIMADKHMGYTWYRNGIAIDLRTGINYDPTSDIFSGYINRNYPFDGNSSMITAVPAQYYCIEKMHYNNGTECLAISDTITIKEAKNVIIPNKLFNEVSQAIIVNSCINPLQLKGDFQKNWLTPIKFTWLKDGIPLTNTSDNKLEVYQNGNYQLETLYKGGCITKSQPYSVTLGKMDVSVQLSDKALCSGISLTNLQLNSNVSDWFVNTDSYGDYPTSYQWYKNNQPIQHANSATLNTTQEGVYRLTVKKGLCETSTEVAVVQEKLPFTMSPVDSASFCDGKSVLLQVSNENDLNYQWEINKKSIDNATASTYLANKAGIYQVLLQRNNCWDYSKPVIVTKKPFILPTAAISGDASINYLDSSKVSVTLTAAAPWTLKLSNGNEYTTYKSPFTFNVKPLTSTTYTLAEVKNMCGTGTVSGAAKIEVIILSTEEEQVNHVSVFPIPTTEKCTWKINLENAGELIISLFDATGVLLKEDSIIKRDTIHEGVIDMEQLSSGVYLLKIQAGDKIITHKIVKH